jgi:phosphatidyl-myo-inositol alpha-mannosyltransferase
VRIALVSPYSWTYPGGVTRHIESLAGELTAQSHDVRVIAPYDPDDALARRLHRGARPQAREKPERFVSLGRTIGIAANGAVSNIAVAPSSVPALRRELREGGYDVVHLHEPVVPLVCWDALASARELPLVGTFHTYSENALTNGIAAVPLGGRRRMNHLRARIAVSEAAAWTARRFFGGRYRIVPNGVRLADDALQASHDAMASDPDSRGRPLRILFVGQAVERKGLPVLLRAFEALLDHLPATLTIVGASAQEVAPMMLDSGRCVTALGKVSEQRKLAELARADVLCAPSLSGESFGMVLTEAFAAATPAIASDIPGYRDVLRDGVDGRLVAAGDAVAFADALRALALDEPERRRMAAAARERAERYAWRHVAGEVLDCYEQAIAIGEPSGRMARLAVRHGLASADLLPRVPAQRLPSLELSAPQATVPTARHQRRVRTLRRAGLAASSFAGAALGALALERVGIARVAASLLASKPGLLVAGVGLMCAAMFVRALSWHAILSVAPTWRRAKRRDAMQGTFIGVLMSATLPARLGEPSRALIVARRLGRARETLPVVLGTMVSQTLLNLVALAILAGVTLSSVSVLDSHDRTLLVVALAPVVALLVVLLAPIVIRSGAVPRPGRVRALRAGLGGVLARVQDGLRVFCHPRIAMLASGAQLGAWTLQLLSCWLLLMALGLDGHAGLAAAAGVLFAVNVTALIPATPANVGVFQAACVAVLAGAYHVSTPDAIAYGIVLQAVEMATALIMGVPALINEGLSWREVRRRTLHAAPVKLGPLSDGGALSRVEG